MALDHMFTRRLYGALKKKKGTRLKPTTREPWAEYRSLNLSGASVFPPIK